MCSRRSILNVYRDAFALLLSWPGSNFPPRIAPGQGLIYRILIYLSLFCIHLLDWPVNLIAILGLVGGISALRLKPTSEPVPVLPPTKFGLQPFDEDLDGTYRCPFGHIAGLNLLSEVTIQRQQWDGSDLARSKQMIGVRGGVGRPHPIILCSPRLWRLFSRHSVRGFNVEVAHLE